MSKRTLSWSAVAVALVLLFAVNILAGALFRTSRVDLTEDDLFTLSDGTRSILADLDEPITLRLFYSRSLATGFPQLQSYAQRVREMLEEYAAHSGGTLRFEEADPEPFSEVEDVAVSYGLQGVPTNATGDLLYFGLVGVNSTDDEEVIPFFDPNRQRALEYDLTELVYKLTNRERRTVAVLSTLPLDGAPANPFQGGQPTEPWFVLEQLRETFEVVMMQPGDDAVPEGAEALVLVHPKQLPPATLYAIDQYVMGGGHALVYVDPLCMADEPPPDPNNQLAAFTADRSSGVPQLFAAWGLELEPGVVAGDIEAAMPQPSETGYVDFLPLLELHDEALADDDIVTQTLSRMTFGMAGSLVPRDGATTTFDPLVRTSEASQKLESQMLLFSEPGTLLDEFVPGGTRLVLAARLSGPAESAFPDGPPDAGGEQDEGESGPGADHVAGSDDIHVIAVADVDTLADRWWVRKQRFFGQTLAMVVNDNGAFAQNAVENLTGSDELISVRSRGRLSRPFDKLDELQREAESRYRAKEQELQAKLAETERRLAELQSQKDPDSGSEVILSDEQLAEIERFEQQRLQTRKELREVKHELRKDIDALASRLELLNVAAMPLLVGLVALGLGVGRNRRRRESKR